MPPALIIQDDFLADPHGARRAALALDYDPKFKGGNYPGLLSTRPLPIEGLEAAASRLIGTAVVAQAGTSHGHCRLTRGGDKDVLRGRASGV